MTLRHVFFAAMALTLSACAHVAPDRLASQNMAKFKHAVRERDLEAASRYLVYFEGKNVGAPEVWAQYYLLACRPRLALAAARRVRDENLANLFEAVISALSSVEREGELPQRAEHVVKASKTKFPGWSESLGPKSEVWADEWADIKVSNAGCKKFPLATGKDAREKLRIRARKLFESLPTDYLIRDLDAAALAYDVGAVIKDVDRVYAAFAEVPSHAYTQKIKSMRSTASEATPKIVVAQTGFTQLQLGQVTISATEWEPIVTPIPILLGDE